MKEYIERKALLNEVESTPWYHIGYQRNLVQGAVCEADALYKATDIYSIINKAPSSDVAKVRHGKWLNTDTYDSHYQPIYKCSECWKDVADNYINCHKYCLHCGAKMDKQSLFEEIKTGLEQAIEYEKHNVKMDKENKNENLGR